MRGKSRYGIIDLDRRWRLCGRRLWVLGIGGEWKCSPSSLCKDVPEHLRGHVMFLKSEVCSAGLNWTLWVQNGFERGSMYTVIGGSQGTGVR